MVDVRDLKLGLVVEYCWGDSHANEACCQFVPKSTFKLTPVHTTLELNLFHRRNKYSNCTPIDVIRVVPSTHANRMIFFVWGILILSVFQNVAVVYTIVPQSGSKMKSANPIPPG